MRHAIDHRESEIRRRREKLNFSAPPRVPASRPNHPRPNYRRREKGPANRAPKIPCSGKQRRRLMKAAAWRLSRLVYLGAARLVEYLRAEPETYPAALARSCRMEDRGRVLRLAKKIVRLIEVQAPPGRKC